MRNYNLCLLLFLMGVVNAISAQSRYSIVGGEDAAENEFPFIVGLATNGEVDLDFAHFCGGSLIDGRWVLTAAHCLYDDNGNQLTKDDLFVFAGVRSLSNPSLDHDRRLVDEVIIHGGYNNETVSNDIALLRLSAPINRPYILLPGEGDAVLYEENNEVEVIGWGALTNDADTYPDILQKAKVDVVSNLKCNSANHYDGIIESVMMCAGKADGSKDACVGDSGGPLFDENDNGFVQLGIVSWGYDCASPTYPGVYTRLERFESWIVEKTGIAANTAHYATQVAPYFYLPHNSAVVFQQTVDLVQLFDMSGRLLAESNNVNTMDLSAFNSGIYILMIDGNSYKINKL